MKQTYFVTGISTDVGKTVVSAILTQALGADYWKPIQAGDLHLTDLHKIKRWVTHKNSEFHDSNFNLQTPMSPHAAARIDGIEIAEKDLRRPETSNNLVVEGAGGWLVPFNDKQTLAEIVRPDDRIVLVSRHYLGSINHTLLSVESIKAKGLNLFGIVFIGDEHPSTEAVIAQLSGVRVLGRMEEEPYIDAHVIAEYANVFKDELTGPR